MNIDAYFEVATGGNHNVATWTPLAIKEFAEAYHKQATNDNTAVFDAEKAAQVCRYYLKHQNLPAWKEMDEFQKGVQVTCENILHQFMTNRVEA